MIGKGGHGKEDLEEDACEGPPSRRSERASERAEYTSRPLLGLGCGGCDLCVKPTAGKYWRSIYRSTVVL